MSETDAAEQPCVDTFLETATRLYMVLDARLVDAHGLGLFDVRLLQVLYGAPKGGMRASDLAEELMLLRTRVSQQIRRLEGQGLVCRHTDVGDRRGVLVAITEDSRPRVHRVLVTFAELVRTHYLAPLTRAQMISLGHGCYRISTALKASQPDTVLSGVQ